MDEMQLQQIEKIIRVTLLLWEQEKQREAVAQQENVQESFDSCDEWVDSAH